MERETLCRYVAMSYGSNIFIATVAMVFGVTSLPCRCKQTVTLAESRLICGSKVDTVDLAAYSWFSCLTN